jgi:ABC-type sugar transport system permease subunit
VLVFVDTWQWLGVLLVASYLQLGEIPAEHFEQAELEGFGRLRRWHLLVWPRLRPVIGLYVCIRAVDWIRKADVIRAFFGQGGPGMSVETFGLYIARLSFQTGDHGYAALLVILQLIILGVGLWFMLSLRPLRSLVRED